MSGTTTLSDWLGAGVAAATEVATTALGCARVDTAPSSSEPSRAPFGAYVPLVAAGCQLQVGVVAEWSVCQALARALFGMEADADFEAESDVSDAIGEIANMVAGGVKTRMNERLPGLNTGLPLCVSGYVEPSAGAEHASAALLFDDVRASVRILLSTSGEPLGARVRVQRPRAAELG